MGQESGKSSWPKPAGGYQTITGRRYGRRHAYVSFRPSPYKRRPVSRVDCHQAKMNNVHKEHATAHPKGDMSSNLPDIIPMPSSYSENLESKTSQNDLNGHRSSSRKMMEREKQGSDLSVPFDKRNSAWDQGDQRSSSMGALSFVNIDSYEPDSSGGEEEDLNSNMTCAIQKRLDMFCDLEKDFGDFGRSCEVSDCSAQEMPSEPGQEDTYSQRTGKTNQNSEFLGKVQSDTCNESASGGGLFSTIEPEHNTSREAVQSEMVVRPKVRKQISQSHLDKTKNSQMEEGAKSVKSTCRSAPPFIPSHSTRTDSSFSFSLNECVFDRTEQEERDRKVEVNDKGDDEFWEDLEDFEEKCTSLEKGDESSEYSEGEWSASWTSDSGLEKEHHSSQESWETLPGLDELPSSSSSLEDIPPLSLTQEEQTPLEEGEIPWLRCNEDSGSSSDENPDNTSQFVHPGLFIMDSSNNLEDDSSMSEDLDTEWRLLDDFEEGFGMAQAISYVDHPQLLTYMALEERLAQAMEAALAHLESLAIDVEQAHPPASEQIIDSLPHIRVVDDLRGQEQSCAICCCEYVNEEIATQLPCRHMFHKLCVTLWLRKSGTCPVCRHVLTPTLNEPSPFLSDEENPSSSPSPAGHTW